MNLVGLLEESAKRFSWRKCLICAGGTLSFHALNARVSELSLKLAHLGIKKGEKVAILMNNCPEFIIALFAIFKLGAACVPLNVFLTLSELRYILGDCGARALVSSSEFLQVLEQMVCERQKGARDLLNLENIILMDKKLDGFLYAPELASFKQDQGLSSQIEPQDLALLIYTSGTTGFPKGVMLSHANLTSNVISSVSALEIKPSERFLLILPMFHSFTLMVCVFVPIYAGARVVIIKSLRPFQKVLRSIFFNRVTVIVGIPDLFDILKNLTLMPLVRMFLRVRLCISGAAPLSIETLETFKKRFSMVSLLEGYGLTEASPVVSLNPLQGIRKPGSIGLPLPGVEVRVFREDESEATCGEIGELGVKGPNVMMGYFRQPEETRKTIKEGWLFTGDMAKIDSDGYIYIVGRKKEMILSHGMNVYPTEIENVLKTHPGIKETAVVGKRDKTKGEIPLAFIVLEKDSKLSEKEIVQFCRDKLAGYKIPRLIEFREALPKTPTGKVLKRKLI